MTVTDAHRLPAEVRAKGIRGEVFAVDDKHVLVRTGRHDAVRFPRSEMQGNVEVGKRVDLQFRARERDKTQEKAPSVEQKRGLSNN